MKLLKLKQLNNKKIPALDELVLLHGDKGREEGEFDC